MPPRRVFPAVLAALAVLAAPVPASGAVVTDGAVRFEVLSPSLVRIEVAQDGRFETRRTLTTGGRITTRPRVSTRIAGPDRVIRTSRMSLRWRRGSTGLESGALRIRVDGRVVRPRTGPNPAPLGGWRRSLDHVSGPVPLFEGVLSRAGWAVVDDTETALLDGGWFAPRPALQETYRDLYVFAYGRRYEWALRDLRTLTGPAPLLPRKAFGVWFSRWWPYGDADWRALVERFRAERVPLDTLSIDTDFKAVHDPAGAAAAATLVGAEGSPYSWNAWDWNRDLYPDPAGFLRWARDEGIEVGLNIHPSISESDPRLAETRARAGTDLVADDGCRLVQADPFGRCLVFDLSDRRQADAYLALHEPFERDGTSFWWLDWCCDGSRADAPGLTPDTWINRLYWHRQRARGSRWPAFQRIGGSLQAGFGGRVGNGALAEHRYAIQFTGDTCATWPFLAFASEFTAAAASIGMPYVSHDIGTFFGVSPTGLCEATLSPLVAPRTNALPPEMYVRWMQLGAFQPLDRLHSHHGLRLPWDYDGKVREVATEFLRLRHALVPHLYALAREAHDTGVPMVRPLYLEWPELDEAYEYGSQYLLGDDLLVAPIARPGDPARVTVWFPPGRWVDRATGETFRGPARRVLDVPLERFPVYLRAGGVLATQPSAPTTAAGPPTSLILQFAAGAGSTRLYDDAGEGLAHEQGAFQRTTVRQQRRDGVSTLVVERRRGRLAQPARRAYELRLMDVDRPRVVTVGGRRTSAWSYDAATRTASVRVGARRTDREFRVVVR